MKLSWSRRGTVTAATIALSLVVVALSKRRELTCGREGECGHADTFAGKLCDSGLTALHLPDRHISLLDTGK